MDICNYMTMFLIINIWQCVCGGGCHGAENMLSYRELWLKNVHKWNPVAGRGIAMWRLHALPMPLLVLYGYPSCLPQSKDVHGLQ